MNERAQFIIQERQRRNEASRGADEVVEAIRGELFGRQIEFMDDESHYKVALCTRRAGKTSLWARYCTAEALQNSRVLIRIWSVSRIRAKQLLWAEFELLFARHKIEVYRNETELTMRFKNGSEIRLVGADKDKEVQKKRGDKTWLEVILETQLFGSMLKVLVEDVLDPCLIDERQRGGGTLCMEGTPGVVCAGYWYNVSGRDDKSTRWQSVGASDSTGAGYSCHRWSVLDNPFMPHAREEVESLRKRRRWAVDNPTYMREWLAVWVNDIGSLYYRFNETKNIYSPLEIQPWGEGWRHVLGWDLGSRDDMAIVVWGYHPDRRDLYEAFSWKNPGALAHEVMEQIEQLEKRGFNFVKKVADTGGGGRMYVEEVMSRYSQVFEAAKKSEKYEHVRLFNEDLVTGHLKFMANSPYLQEISVLPIDPDWLEAVGFTDGPDAKPGEKPYSGKPPTEDPRFPNHCCDAGLYGYRAAMHWLHEETTVAPKNGSKEYFDELEKRLEASVLANEEDESEWWEPQGDDLEYL